mgnify:CR=1 FL=1
MPFLTQWPMPPNLVESYNIVGVMRNVVIQGDSLQREVTWGIYTQTSKSNLLMPCEEEEEIICSFGCF